MATKKKTVAKKAVPAKAKAPVKATPAKKAAPAKPSPKKAVQKPVAKKPAPKPAKKAAPAKPAPKKSVAKPTIAKPSKAQVKPVAKKAAPVKKAAPAKKAAPVKQPAPVKKPIPAKTAEPLKKAAPEKKPTVTVAKSPASQPKPAVKAPAKPVSSGIKAIAKNPKDIKIPHAKPVVIPKIATKTARKYQPDFTKSVLDQQKQDPGAPMTRYSDSELTEFREIIQRKLDAAKKELQYLQGLITRKDEQGGDESENRYMTMEDGSLSMEREQLSQMASRQITFIDHLEKALMRIENKTYGICRVTGKLIDKARLRAVPHATLSIEAKMGKSNH
jgi:RNA polymerase-binding transcription factor DksA